MQNILIEVSHQDQIFVEDECTKHGYTLSGFFEKLLNDYRIPNKAPVGEINREVKETCQDHDKGSVEEAEDVKENLVEKDEKPKKTRKRKS